MMYRPLIKIKNTNDFSSFSMCVLFTISFTMCVTNQSEVNNNIDKEHQNPESEPYKEVCNFPKRILEQI